MLLQKCLNTDIQTTKKTETKKNITFLEGLRDHGDLVLFVGGLREALETRGLDHGLAEADHGVRHFDVDLGVEFSEVMHDAVKVELARAQHDVLPGLLHAGV